MFPRINNKIILIKNGKEHRLFWVKGLKVRFHGSNNRVIFYDKVPYMKHVKFDMGDSSQIFVKQSKYRIKDLSINAGATNVTVNIGEDFSIESGKFDFHGEPDSVIDIGDDCQFGCNISLDTADGHTIYDMGTKEVLNGQKDIKISSHVWLCENVSVLKGATIAENSVVGKNSLVTSKLDTPNSIYVGSPAVRLENPKYSNCNWAREAIKTFIKGEKGFKN